MVFICPKQVNKIRNLNIILILLLILVFFLLSELHSIYVSSDISLSFKIFKLLIFKFILQRLFQVHTLQMFKKYSGEYLYTSSSHLLKPILCCIAWDRHQEALVSMGIQIKLSSYVLIKIMSFLP